MDEEKPRKRQMTKFGRWARNRRIVKHLREGFGYDEIAREERLTERSAPPGIATEAREGREALDSGILAICRSIDAARARSRTKALKIIRLLAKKSKFCQSFLSFSKARAKLFQTVPSLPKRNGTALSVGLGQ